MARMGSSLITLFKPFVYRRKHFGGFVVGLSGIGSIWTNKDGLEISIPEPGSVLKWIEVGLTWGGYGPNKLEFMVYVNGGRVVCIPKWRWRP